MGFPYTLDQVLAQNNYQLFLDYLAAEIGTAKTVCPNSVAKYQELFQWAQMSGPTNDLLEDKMLLEQFANELRTIVRPPCAAEKKARTGATVPSNKPIDETDMGPPLPPPVVTGGGFPWWLLLIGGAGLFMLLGGKKSKKTGGRKKRAGGKRKKRGKRR